MADQPDPRDFVARAGTRLTLLGTPLRFGGVNVTWLGIRQDAGAAPRRPTKYEIGDALGTVQALGAQVVRLPGLADTAGCALCLEPTPGTFSEDAFAQIDQVLMSARDLGIKVILPLADRGTECAGADADGVICGTVRLLGLSGSAAFFTDARAQVAFADRVQRILDHRNSLTGVLYRDDPTILAWESCDACGLPGNDAAVSAWVEQTGQTIKATDKHHLYENGAFAGRISHTGTGPAPAPAVAYATPSVDVIGDHLVPQAADLGAERALIADTLDEVAKTDRAYILDDFGWSPAEWKTLPDLEGWLNAMVRARVLAGAITGDLQAHSDQGGNLPAAPPRGFGIAALYFPGAATADMDLPTMQDRARALRRFNYAMTDVFDPPTYRLPPKPEIVTITHGRVVWRGAAGAATYSIERSPDPGLPGSWTTICDSCTTDTAGFWQDPQPPEGISWYRVMPFNINGHRAEPSLPAQAGK
jgi:hypothetical protein